MKPVILPAAATLTCHPQTPCTAIAGIRVEAVEGPGGALVLDYVLEGDLSAVRIPDPGPPRRADGLWRQTCLEAFVMAGEGPGYLEYNFSPSGAWAGYAFRSYREGGDALACPVPGIAVHSNSARLALDASIPAEALPAGPCLRLGLSAVVEDGNGVLSYWALRHPPGKPDFHHPDAFALQLALPGMQDSTNPTRGART